jgi:hypothetical protein
MTAEPTSAITARATPPRAAAPPASRLRRASLTALVLLLGQYVLGMAVNIYVTVPKADHGAGPGDQISNGPALLSAHIVMGLGLVVAAVGLVVGAVRARERGTIATSAVALLAIVGAAGSGTGFVSDGDNIDSMIMAVLTAVALVCYALNLYRLGARRLPGGPEGAAGPADPAAPERSR